MAAEGARVRAPLTKSILDLLDARPSVVRDRVRARAADAVRHVEQASRVDWITLRTQLQILSALRAEVGQRGYEEFCAAHFATMVQQPLVRSAFETTVRLFGVGPGPVYRIFPKSWAMMSRGCGVVHVPREIDPAGTRIRVVDLPVQEEEIELFVQGFRATFRGIIDIFQRRGDVTLESYDARARTSTYVATWK